MSGMIDMLARLRADAASEQFEGAISECSDHDRNPDYASADRAEECLRAELQRLTAERDELAARLAEIEAQEPVAWVPIHPRTGPLWSMTTGSPDPERLPHYPLKPLYTCRSAKR